MSNTIVRAALGLGVASLTLATVDLYLVLRRPHAMPLTPVVAPVAGPTRSAASAPAPVAAAHDAPAPIRRSYPAVDATTGEATEAFLPDDRAKLERFIVAAKLGAEETRAIRERYYKRELQEAAVAQEMSRARRWDWERVRSVIDAFWQEELSRLPNNLALALSPEFHPRPRRK